jgi:hypothetical protein
MKKSMAVLAIAMVISLIAVGQTMPWKMYTIDDKGFGADGVKLWQNKQLNVFTVSWEQSGESRCYVYDKNLSYKHAVSVPSPGVEDAIVADITGDEIPEIISFLEKPGNCISINYPQGNWLTHSKIKFSQHQIKSSENQSWMFGVVADIDNNGKPDIIAGSKGDAASVSVFYQLENKQWKQQKLCDVGWIMTLELHDMDNDGDKDIFFTDRKGSQSGVKWLENTGIKNHSTAWKVHVLALEGNEPMFAHIHKRGNSVEIYATEIYKGITKITLSEGHVIASEPLFTLPEIAGKRLKDVCIGDLNMDGEMEIITAYEGAKDRHGIVYSAKTTAGWKHYPLSDKKGIKFDLSLLFDMDNDGDLDVLNTEENNNSSTNAGLGFVWYENPFK